MEATDSAIDAASPSPDVALAAADSVTVWGLWYFRQGALSLITVPLLLFLAYCVIVAAVGAVVEGLALFRAAHVAFGAVGTVGAIVVGWFPVALPPIIYFSLLKAFPTLWLRPDATTRQRLIYSLLVLILLPLLAYLTYHGVALLIGWLADRDPCGALSAGITGSQIPSNCQ